MCNAFLAFLNGGEVGCQASSSGISVQVLLPGEASLNFTNLSQTEGNTDVAHCSPEELKRSVLGPLVLGP